jgi:hypothetical protein
VSAETTVFLAQIVATLGSGKHLPRWSTPLHADVLCGQSNETVANRFMIRSTALNHRVRVGAGDVRLEGPDAPDS